MKVFGFSHEIVSPRDVATGQASGKRQHQPFRCVVQQGKSTPQLFQALSVNKVIPTVTVSFFRPNPIGDGTTELYIKYVLTNASISSVRPWMANIKDTSVANFGSQVELAFTYEKITWTYTNGGITAEDSWSAQVR
jgi:type VI secretion system secreted protein Hcp